MTPIATTRVVDWCIAVGQDQGDHLLCLPHDPDRNSVHKRHRAFAKDSGHHDYAPEKRLADHCCKNVPDIELLVSVETHWETRHFGVHIWPGRVQKLIATLLCLACVACGHTYGKVAIKPAQPSPAETQEECLGRSGTWGLHGTTESTEPFCALPTTDAGQPCTDYLQCQGHCLAPNEAPEGRKVIGTCAASYFPGSCFNLVQAGKASGRICE